MSDKFVSLDELMPVIIEKLDSEGSVIMSITGNSMYPMMSHRRDCVTLTRPTVIKNHDVVLFKRESGKYVLHRIIKVKNGKFNICGDNTFTVDKDISQNQIIAVVTAFERNGKHVDVKSFFYRMYSRLWFFLPIFVFRRYLRHFHI